MFFLGGVSATYGLWDGKLRGKSAEEAFGDTEAHNLKSRDVTMVNKCLFFCIFCNPILLLVHCSTKGQGTNNFAQQYPTRNDVLQNIYLKTNYIVGNVLAARGPYIYKFPKALYRRCPWKGIHLK